MSWYINTNTDEERQFDDAWFNACVSAVNPKVDGWVKMDPQPQPQPPEPQAPQPYRVSKDTIVSRVNESGKLNDLITLINTLPVDQSFMWTHFAWFWSNNPTIVGMCQSLGLDPLQILATDSYLP